MIIYLRNFIEYLDMKEIIKNYQVKHFKEYCLFLEKKTLQTQLINIFNRKMLINKNT